MSIVSTNVQHRLETERNKKTFVDEYGTIVGWLKLIADFIMAPCGLILDGMVLYSLFYLATKNEILSIAVAISVAAVLQVLYGKPAAIAAKSFFTGRYQHKGTKAMMGIMLVFTAAALSFSVWLSLRSDMVIEKLGQSKFEMVDENPIQNKYDNKAETLATRYQQRQQTLLDEAKTLDNDKIMWRGKWTTRERSSRAAAKIRKEQLPALEEWYNNELERLETQREQAVAKIDNKNTTTATKFEEYIYEGGATLKFVNVSFNIARVVIIVVFIYFIVQAMEETVQQKHYNSVANRGSSVSAPSFSPSVATAAQQPATPDRTIVKPFSTVLPMMQQKSEQPATKPAQQPATPVANRGTTKQQEQNKYNITLVDGEPTVPWTHGRSEKQFTLKDVQKYIGIYEGRNQTDNNQRKLEALYEMKKELLEAKES